MLFLDIKIKFDSKKQLDAFFGSIKPELNEEFKRSETKIASKGESLEVSIRASDKTALRASLNSITKPLKLFNQLEALE
ncbi:MAG: hypothetical protein HON47_00480 [Candidatus Diapherotrites archaeon]|jgi:tRNA threonylcarbamoyladenosine modification (KEOPS) complex  Pcc1 subunit|uniref:Transcription factor Pcc1 n=1 Tax=Candidatus Iainarchaeum sp. TaxID=3101447 RepID=A0A8T5GES3_9ARCH|nr:hypothetical protein [Candidatus Diapherotrites archaeon]MBT7241711.1 hypothetical protein [Candidatus Diapherotrites archaeon]